MMWRAAFALALLLHGASAAGHGRDPESVTLEERGDGTVDVRVRVVDDPSRAGAPWSFALSPRCVVVDPPVREAEARGERWRWRVGCGRAGLDGVVVDSLGAAHETLLTVRRRDGALLSRALRPAVPWVVVPRLDEPAPSPLRTVRSFAGLGVAHLATGADHLLFLVLLLVRVRGARARVRAVTAFTAGHAVTLAAAALDLVAVPRAWVEALVAGTVWLLAADTARTPRTELSHPWALPLAFGLVHGLGFADGLRDAGLRAGERGLALAAVNAGLEVAQLAVVAVALGVEAVAARTIAADTRERAARAVVFAAGVAGGAWLCSRVQEMVA